jgi:hypothetical protein
MSYKNVFFSADNNIGENLNGIAGTDTGHGRLDKCATAIFTGATAPSRLSKFLRTYVNVAEINANVNAEGAKDPVNYTNTDVGLPISCVLCIYFADGMWYLIYQNHNPYDAAIMPFNKVPEPYDVGTAL